MKQFMYIFFSMAMLLHSVSADELVYGVDIDSVYQKSDWKSKDEIREIVKGYALLKRCQAKLQRCQAEEDEEHCYDKLAEKIFRSFYGAENTHHYLRLKKQIASAYQPVFYENKFTGPQGTMRAIFYNQHITGMLREYLRDVLAVLEDDFHAFEFLNAYQE